MSDVGTTSATDAADRLASLEDELRGLGDELRGGAERAAEDEVRHRLALLGATVEVGPLTTDDDVEAFRAWLAGAPGARDVRLSAFEDGRAVFEVQLRDG